MFHHYLALLSALRVLRPFKIRFHYEALPLSDDFYNTWLQVSKVKVVISEVKARSSYNL
jgi:hypothetical protein